MWRDVGAAGVTLSIRSQLRPGPARHRTPAPTQSRARSCPCVPGVPGHDGTDSGSPTVALNVPAEPGARGAHGRGTDGWAHEKGLISPGYGPWDGTGKDVRRNVGAVPDASPTDVPEEFLPAAGPGLSLRPSGSHSSPRL